ncbi:MAG: hypothetical protein SCJ97_02255 [Bacillota bacterium]|nr:hypothetical protein [Bacillota bacterium]
MREISLEEIKQITNSPAGKKIKEQVSIYVRSKPGYSGVRKRPRNTEETKILESFRRK